MRDGSRTALFLLLLACHAHRAGKEAIAAADLFTRQHEARQLRASVAGSDCRILLIRIGTGADDALVESIHYGTQPYDAFGGVEQFAHDRGFRAVVYRDAAGNLRTYGATTRDEARSMPGCR